MKKTISVTSCLMLTLLLSGCFGIFGTNRTQSQGEAGPSFQKSTNGGKIFEPKIQTAGEGTIGSASILKLERDPSSPGRIVLGLEQGGMLRTQDGGEIWEQIDFPPPKVYGLEIVPGTDGQTMYATGEWRGRGRIYKTSDGGQNWEEIYAEPSTGSVLISMAMHPQNSDEIFIGTSKGVIFKTDDGGLSWQPVDTVGEPVVELIFDGVGHNVIYGRLHESRDFIKSDNAGASFEKHALTLKGQEEEDERTRRPGGGILGRGQAGAGGSGPIISMDVDERQRGEVYVSTTGAVFRSTDFGESFEALDLIGSVASVPIAEIGIRPGGDNELLFSANGQLYLFRNNKTETTSARFGGGQSVRAIHYDLFDTNVIYMTLRQ